MPFFRVEIDMHKVLMSLLYDGAKVLKLNYLVMCVSWDDMCYGGGNEGGLE